MTTPDPLDLDELEAAALIAEVRRLREAYSAYRLEAVRQLEHERKQIDDLARQVARLEGMLRGKA